MGIFDSLISSDLGFLIDADATPGVESVTYKPVVGTAVTRNVTVRRLPPEPSAESNVMLHHITIYVVNDSTLGVTSVNKQGDTVLIPRQQGGVAVELAVVDIIAQDAGGWLLLLR